MSFALAAFFYAMQPVVAGIQPLWGLVKYLAYINFARVAFDLIPGFPPTEGLSKKIQLLQSLFSSSLGLQRSVPERTIA
jgi:hypothetical protein